MERDTWQAAGSVDTPIDDPAEHAALALDGVLDLNAAGPLCRALLQRRGSDLTVDASEVRHLGALCAQALTSAFATWRDDGRSFRVAGATEAFAQGARLLGLQHTLIPEGSQP